jgi:hypothetical protein
VESKEEAMRALPRVLSLDRRAVRQRFEERFSAARMAHDYVGVYRSLLRTSTRADEDEAKPVRSSRPTQVRTNGQKSHAD